MMSVWLVTAVCVVVMVWWWRRGTPAEPSRKSMERSDAVEGVLHPTAKNERAGEKKKEKKVCVCVCVCLMMCKVGERVSVCMCVCP